MLLCSTALAQYLFCAVPWTAEEQYVCVQVYDHTVGACHGLGCLVATGLSFAAQLKTNCARDVPHNALPEAVLTAWPTACNIQQGFCARLVAVPDLGPVTG